VELEAEGGGDDGGEVGEEERGRAGGDGDGEARGGAAASAFDLGGERDRGMISW
jgi:hypothetical protein